MKYRLVCFDLDGTLVDETKSIWQSIHTFLEIDEERRKRAMEKYYAKEITYQEWADHDMAMWAERNAKKEDFLKAISHLRLMEGTRETLHELKKRGYKLVLLSGSLSLVLDLLIPDYKEVFDHTYINHIFFDEDGNISGADWLGHPSDEEGKAEELREVCRRFGIPLGQSVFVGDEKNDLGAIELAGLGIAFNSQSEKLNHVADIIIEKKDVREILKHL